MPKPTDHLAAARAALQLCTPGERAKLFAEFNHTVVDEVKNLARVSPGAAAGALVGGVLGLWMDAPKKPTCTKCSDTGVVAATLYQGARYCECVRGERAKQLLGARK